MLEDDFLFTLGHPRFYESLERVPINRSDFITLVKRRIPASWMCQRNSYWYHCMPSSPLLPQGWKIHLSATLANSATVLFSALPILRDAEVAFKFVADKDLLFHVNGKRWARGAAGKFMTIYPHSTDQCRRLLEDLYAALLGYSGPYVLSDRRYRDSKNVYYRYGGIQPIYRLNVEGIKVPVIRSQPGEIMDDVREPNFKLPEGVTDPFQPELDRDDQGDQSMSLKDGRYRVESAITFSNSGGVYIAQDQRTSNRVIIKEARPYTQVSPRGTDAVWLLKKEHRLLEALRDVSIAPAPVDFFKDWEHYYLVEEMIDGKTLRLHFAETNLALRIRPTREDMQAYFDSYRALFIEITAGLRVLHDHDVVFGDMSHYNVMIQREGGIRFIDFEGAYQKEVDIPTVHFTPGFAPLSSVLNGAGPSVTDDAYGLGGLMLAGLLPINGILMLDSQAHLRLLKALARDFGLPEDVYTCIAGLLSTEEAERLEITEVEEILSDRRQGSRSPVECLDADIEELREIRDRTIDHVVSVANYERSDRFFPADPMVFSTNPMSVAHGACGVALAVQRVRGELPSELRRMLSDSDLDAGVYPPGLYVGLAGVSWTLLELGFCDRAEEVMRATAENRLLWDSPDLFYGAAGWGLAQLRFFLATGDQRYLANAERAGRFLERTRQEHDDGTCYWLSDRRACCGLAHGVAGIALFLLYLYLAGKQEEFLHLGRRGLEFAIRRPRINRDGGLTWPIHEDHPTVTPYWRSGSAGIGMAALRYWAVLGERELETFIDGLSIDTDRKYAIFPGRFFGLAGIGEFYLDRLALNYGSEDARASARKLLSGVLLFRVQEAEGIAFPGESLQRISCDYGTGSAGIALFIDRWLTGAPAPFMLDDLFMPSPEIGA